MSTPGTYVVTVTCADGSTAFTQVGVAGFTTGIGVFGSGNICQGQCATVSVLLVGGSNGPYEIVLELSTGGTQTFNVNPAGSGGFAIISLCPTQTTTYTIQSVTNSQGCVAFLNPTSNSITLNVSAGGPLSINGPAAICPGQTTSLTADPSNYQSYSWSNGGSGSSTTISAPGTYSVTATIAGGCSATASITVATNPFTPPTINGGSLLCPGSSLTLTAEGGPYTSYAWSNGQSGSSTTVTATGTYTVTVTSANGCTGTDSEVVSPGTLASTSITGPASVCPNSTINLTATGSFQSYAWSSGQSSSSISVSTPGTYTVTVTNSDGCTGTASQTVGTAPLPSVSFSVADPNVCAGDCITFSVALGGTPPFTLIYTSPVSGQQTQSFSSNSGTLQICPPSGASPGTVSVTAVSISDANCTCN